MLTGIYVPLITPFTASGSVALDVVEKLAHHVLDEGATGLVALGTTAEAASLSSEERLQVISVCARVSSDRGTPLIVGASPSSLSEIPDMAAAALVTVPSFVRPGERGVVAHFQAVAAASPVPLVIYHIPYRTGQVLSAASLMELAAHPRIIGVKYATGGIDQDAVDLLGAAPSDFAVLGGDDVFISPLLALGASGGILASAHLRTRDFADLVEAWAGADVERARSLGHRLAPLSSALFAEPNPTVVKGVLHAQGLIPTASVRLPLLAAQPAAVEQTVELLDLWAGPDA